MPVDILTRAEKGTALSHNDMDNNFTLLQDAVNASKLESVSVNSSPYDAGTNRLILADATSGAIIVNLPDAATSADLEYVIKKVDASVNTVTVSSTDNIDGATDQVLATQYENIRVFCDGTTWYIV